MNDTEVPSMVQIHVSIRVLLTLLPCILFLYINGIMLFALLKKPLFLESPRYILFGHLLFSDSLQVLLTTLLYVLALTMVRIITCACIIVIQFAAITVKMSPINLAVMSLERFVAICFPLRHPTIATVKATRVAIAVMWTVASVDSLAQLFLFFRLSNGSLLTHQVCRKRFVFHLHVYVILNRVFTLVNFVLVTVIIIYTYVATMIAAKSSSCSAHRAKIAHKTMILHVLQLCLYLISIVFNMINSSDLFQLEKDVALYFKHMVFLCLILFPKFLSPLIYGLKDQTFRDVFKYYFTFGYKSSVEPYPKS